MAVRYIQCTNGWVEVTVVARRPHQARVVAAPPPGAREAGRTRVDMRCADVVALYEGTTIERAWRIADLAKRHIRFRRIFGGRTKHAGEASIGEGESYDMGRKYVRIGRAFPPPEGACGRCEALDDACPGCARQIVNDLATRLPVNRLRCATGTKDPREQWRLLYQAELADRRRATRRRQEQARVAKACTSEAHATRRRAVGDVGAARCA